jgi:hypothetical protein
MRIYDGPEGSIEVPLEFIVVIIVFGALVAFQQSYAKSHTYGIEQPIGLLGFADYYFRHPEKLLGF